ncbi:MAG TPA: hypothetical protein VE978_18365 [Chitinophagales bacterium]|nr:hypothetical protein [Chitinophagales bacterium]
MKITNLITGERVRCTIEKASREDVLRSKKNFTFDWIKELSRASVFKIISEENPEIVQAFFSFKIDDDFIYMSLLERANYKSLKVYDGITELAFGFVCKMSFEKGFDGYVSFQPKTVLAGYYQQLLNARSIGGSQQMYLNTEAAEKLLALLDEEEN